MRVPFPYVERDRIARRPALVVGRPIGPDESLLWLVMITSARAGKWPGDVTTGADHAALGLPVPCFIRTAKIVTVQIADIDGRLGRLPDPLLRVVRGHIADTLSSPAQP